MLRVTLVAASALREQELPGFEQVRDFASESQNLAIFALQAAALEDGRTGTDVEITAVDIPTEFDSCDVGLPGLSAVLDTEPDLLALSLYCWSRDALLALAQEVKKARPQVFVLLGGPSAGPHAEQLLTEHRWIDAIATGEGEPTFVELLIALRMDAPLTSVPGLALWQEGRVLSTASEPADLSMGSPYRRGLLAPINGAMVAESSRGCAYRCRFCSWAGASKGLRYVPAEVIKKDLEWARQKGVRLIKFADTAINFDTGKLGELIQAANQADPDKKLSYIYFLRPKLVTDRQVELLHGIKTQEIIMGVETLSDEARKKAAKGAFDPRAFEEMADLLGTVGPITITVMLGLPGDSAEGLERTLRWLVDLPDRCSMELHIVILSWLAVLPGSRFDRQKEDYGFRVMPRGTPYFLESAFHDPFELLSMARLAAELHYAHPQIRLEHFHKEYLAEDGAISVPSSVREKGREPIPRFVSDGRKVVLLLCVGTQKNQSWPPRGVIELAEIKAAAEADPAVLRRFSLPVAHVPDPASIPEVVAKLNTRPDAVICVDDQGEPFGLAPFFDGVRHHFPDARVLVVDRAPDDLVVDRAADELVAELLDLGDGGFAREDPELAPFLCKSPSGPSPYQWGFIPCHGTSVAMVLRRERLFGDIRWAVEKRCAHIEWLDEPLFGTEDEAQAFVTTVKRADRSGRLSHTLTLDPTQTESGALEVLNNLPLRSLRLIARKGRLVQKWAAQRQIPTRLVLTSAQAVARSLRPWQEQAKPLSGWTITAVQRLGQATAVQCRHTSGGRARAWLVAEPLWIRVAALHAPPPQKALETLGALLATWVKKARPHGRFAR